MNAVLLAPAMQPSCEIHGASNSNTEASLYEEVNTPEPAAPSHNFQALSRVLPFLVGRRLHQTLATVLSPAKTVSVELFCQRRLPRVDLEHTSRRKEVDAKIVCCLMLGGALTSRKIHPSTGLTLLPMSFNSGQELMRTAKAVPRVSVERRLSSSVSETMGERRMLAKN